VGVREGGKGIEKDFVINAHCCCFRTLEKKKKKKTKKFAGFCFCE
jgi:hypothetical protein